MEKTGGINLLRTDATLSSKELLLLKRVKILSIMLLCCIIGVGFLVGSAYAAAQMRISYLENTKTSVSRRISLQARKEVLLKTVKERLPSAEKVIASQYPWESILDHISQIALPPVLQNVSINENSVITLGVIVPNFEEIEVMTQKLLELSQAKQIKAPALLSIRTLQSGNYEVYVAFQPLQ